MKSCERLDMLSLNLSHKNLLVPLLVCKHSVSPGPSVSRRSYLVHLNLPPALHFLLFPHLSCPFQSPHFVDLSNFCLSALFSSSFSFFLNYTIYVLLSFCQFHFSSHYTFFLIPFLSFIMSLVLLLNALHPLSFSFPIQRTSTVFTSTLSCLASNKGISGIYTYHTQVDWREGLWHRQIIERIQQVIQVIFLGNRNKQQKK